MTTTKTIDFKIHFVNTLLQNKGTGSLAVIEKYINELKLKKDIWDKSLQTTIQKQASIAEGATQAQVAFEQLLKDKETKMIQLIEVNQNK